MNRSNSHDRMSRDGRRGRNVALAAIALTWVHGAAIQADNAADREYKIKAAFIYNFLKFVEGGRFVPAPEKKAGEPDPNDPIVIGILGVPPSRAAFAEFTGKEVANRRIAVLWFKGFEELADEDDKIPEQHPDLERIRKCHVLFVCPSEKTFLTRILPPLRDSGILIIGDVPTFLEAGGTINLLIENKKVRFEINLAAVTRAKFTVRSSLLRLAFRTIEHDRLEPRQDEEASHEDG